MAGSMTEQDMINEQIALSRQIVRENTVVPDQVRTVAGTDLAYWEQDGKEHAVCCIVVIDPWTFEVLERVCHEDTVDIPYIPGCLAFREIPVFMEAYKKLRISPDVIFFDGNGYLHPRHMGLATHAGILIGKATVGIAKSYHKIAGTDFEMPMEQAGAHTDIRIGGEVYGRALRTHTGVKPVFLSVGNAVDLDTATKMAMRLTAKEGHIPMPTRLADIMTHEERRASQDRQDKERDKGHDGRTT